MQFAVDQAYDADLEVATANYPNIRLITVPQTGTQEVTILKGSGICVPRRPWGSLAVGYDSVVSCTRLGVPIGLIDNSWGGSAAEAWVARDVLEADPRFAAYLDQWKTTEATYDHEKAVAAWKVKSRKQKLRVAGAETAFESTHWSAPSRESLGWCA